MRFYAGCFLGDAEHCMLDCFNEMVLFRVEEKYTVWMNCILKFSHQIYQLRELNIN
jgi:hypothetical protein